MNRKFPLYIDLSGRDVLVYGGGAVAARRVKTLSQFGPHITVIAPEIHPDIRALPAVRCRFAAFCAAEMPQADLVLAATSEPSVNHAVVMECRKRGIPVNNASSQAECDFQFPAVAIQNDVVVGVNAGGTDHRLVRRIAAAIRKQLENLL